MNNGQTASNPFDHQFDITSALPTTHQLSGKPTSKWAFIEDSQGYAIAIICRLEPCAELRRRSFRERSRGFAPSVLLPSRLASTRRCACRPARDQSSFANRSSRFSSRNATWPYPLQRCLLSPFNFPPLSDFACFERTS